VQNDQGNQSLKRGQKSMKKIFENPRKNISIFGLQKEKNVVK
jgi:hypothetical protein